MAEGSTIKVDYLFSEDERTILWDLNYGAKERTVVNQGGTSSGKTYAIMQVLFQLGFDEPNSIITVVGQDIPNLKVGAYRDAKTIMGAYEIMPAVYPVINEGERIIKCYNGSLIEFKSYADAQDAKSGKRDYLFVNEANGIPYDVFWQLAIRTRRRIFIDYNPTARFWVHDELIGRSDVLTLYSWHKHNTFLTDEEHQRIEGISDPELHKVYARGRTGMVQGLVLTNWDICDTLPPRDEWKMSAYGLDFGYSCFKGDTLVMTSKGEKPIKDVTAGDWVLTRYGYHRVKRNIYNGHKKVLQKKFIKGLRSTNIFCTFEHNFNANGTWKKYGELTVRDNLFLLSSSMAWNTEGIPTANTKTIISTNGKKMGCITQNSCIMRFMKKSMVKFQMAWSSITKISMLLIMTSATLLCLPYRNICGFIMKSGNGERATSQNLRKDAIQRKIGTNEGKRYLTTSQTNAEPVNGVELNIHPQIHINDFAASNVTTDGNIRQKKTILQWFANIAEKLLRVINISSQNVAARNVRIVYQPLSGLESVGVEWCDVYDLEIEGVHEYFANGVLVHNCDPSALEHVVEAHGDLWIDEGLYSTGMTNPDIAERAKGHGITSNDQIIADCAEPKSIRELQAEGLWVTPSPKGQDSIVSGLDILRRYRLHVTRRSVGIIGNLRSYQWGKDRDGNMTNKPEDRNNHGIDAIRYVALEKLSRHREVRGVRRRN